MDYLDIIQHCICGSLSKSKPAQNQPIQISAKPKIHQLSQLDKG